MRPCASLCQASRHRLLTLLLVLLLAYIGAHTVNGSPEDLGDISEYSRTLQGGTSVVRVYRLNSLCSNLDVQMGTRKKAGYRARSGRRRRPNGQQRPGARKKALNARGQPGSSYSLLRFESHGPGIVSIYGINAQKYLCFSRQGRLIIRHHGQNETCLFREQIDNNYTMLQSMANHRWYVGFNKRGRKMKGYHIRRRKRKNCYYFSKKPMSPQPHRRTRPTQGPLTEINLKKLESRLGHR